MEISIQILTFILGTCLGSFISVLIERIHSGRSGILFGRSECPKCKHPLGAIDLMPILSYISTRGKCRYCKKTISPMYPFLEITMGIVALLLLETIFLLPVAGIFYLYMAAVLLFTFIYDIKYMEISDRILLPAIGIAFAMTFFSWYEPSTSDALIGFLIPTLFFLSQILISKGRWIGGGDLRIGALMGLLLGWQKVIVALFLGYFSGALISLILLSLGKVSRKTMIPFGPFLIIGTLLAAFWGNEIIEWYLNMTYIN